MSDAFLIACPILLPLLAAALLLLCRRSDAVQRQGLWLVMTGNLAAGLGLFQRVQEEGEPFSVAFGGWQAPVGIVFYADLLAAIMVLVTSVVALAGAVFALGEIGRSIWRRHFAIYYCLLITGINGAFLTGDLFNLFVWFEVMLMSSFAMLVLGRRKETLPGSTKYVVLNMVSSFFFLSGLGILYGKVGSLNLEDVAQRVVQIDSDPLILTSATLLLVAFGIKAGAFPLYFWLPASYPQSNFTTSAVFGGLLTKVGVYALFRVFGGAFGFLSEWTSPLFLIGGVATMVAGVLGAASQFHSRRILSFHIISQIGYLIFGLGLFTQGAFAAAIFYTVHHILVKTNLFFAAGLIFRAAGSEDLAKIGGLFKARPGLAVLFAVPALSLGGIPPLSGFFAKFLLLREAFHEGAYLWGGVAFAVGVLTLFSMSKIWAEAFWKAHPKPEGPVGTVPLVQWLPVLVLGLMTIAIGFYVGPLFEISEQAASQLLLLNPEGGPTP